MRSVLLIFLMLYAVFSFSQGVDLRGKVNAYILKLDGIYVINLKTEQAVFTDEEGNFSIKANVGDTLVFSGLQFKRKEVVVVEENISNKKMDVHLMATYQELNEVVIRNYGSINAVSLGIVSSNLRHYTPAERKLATASSSRLNPQGLDPIINLISGRTAMLKKEVEVEKKENYIVMLEKMFDRDHFINTLHLPLDYINGFKYYVVENKRFTQILESKNLTTIEFLIGELAVQYKEVIACENE
jgi:hypothetical protein